MASLWNGIREMTVCWIRKAGMKLGAWLGNTRLETRWAFLFFLLMVVAFGLRSPFLSKGHEDEYHTIGRSMQMLYTGDLNPHSFVYPTGPMYFTAVADVLALASISRDVGGSLGSGASPLGLIRKAQPNPLLLSLYKTQNVDKTWDHFRYQVRIIHLLLIPLMMGLLYYIAVRTALYLPAFGAGLLLAFCSANIQDSIYVSVNSLTGFMCLQAVAWMVFCSALPAPKGIFSWLLRIAGLAFLIGMGTACKYNAGIFVLLPLLYGWMTMHDHGTGVAWTPEKAVLLCGVTGLFLLLGFTLLCPYWFKELPLFLQDVLYEVWHYKVGHASYNTFEPGLQMAWINLQCLADQTSWLGLITTGLCMGYLAYAGFLRMEEYRQIRTVLLPVLIASAAFFVMMSTQAVFFSRNFSILWPGWFLCCTASWWFASGLLVQRCGWAHPARIQTLFTMAVLLVCVLKAGLIDPAWFGDSRQWWRKNDEVLTALRYWLSSPPEPSHYRMF